MAPLFPTYRCDSGANGARPPDHFHSPHPDGRPRPPSADTLPHSFLRTPPSREAFPHGAEPPVARPRTEQPSSTTKGGERRATLFAFLRSYIIYTRARRGTFPPLGGRGLVRPAVEKRKGGEKRTGRWTFSPHRGKDCGKQIVDKWKIGALFPPLRNERIQSGEHCPSSGALNPESAARSPQSPHEVAKTCIKAREVQPLPTEKPAHRHGNSASDRENTAIVNKKRA